MAPGGRAREEEDEEEKETLHNEFHAMYISYNFFFFFVIK